MELLRRIDWILLFAIIPPLVFGLLTMKSLGGNDYFFWRQLMWIGIGICVMTVTAAIDWRNYKSSGIILSAYAGVVGILAVLVLVGKVTRGIQGWLYVGSFGIEPVEFAKFILVVLFAKYFSGRHVEIALMRHIVISFFYLAIPLGLVFIQPDVGSAAILFFIWGCMVLFSGMTLKQIGLLALSGTIAVLIAWMFLLHPYQKSRIVSFLQPERDPRGSGYHAIQAMIAVGSGGVHGKGVGYGTQSRLNFLPESQTDFIFAAFAEEWGLIGISIIFVSFGVIFWRLIHIALGAPENFPKLVTLGFAFLLLGHMIIHIGMNVGLLPITGIGLPFMSYGGSFLLILMAFLGIAQSVAMRSSIRAYADEGSLILTP